MKKYFVLSCALAVFSHSGWAQWDSECDPDVDECPERAVVESEDYKKIYPFVPMATAEVQKRVQRLTESDKYVVDLREITRLGLTKADTKVQPWGGSFWPLNQGQIANPYHDTNYDAYVFSARKLLNWRFNFKNWEKRVEKVYPKVYELSEADLAKLAPSEKYDLLLGDTNFDLTKRIWNYAQTWGEKKKWGFLSSIDLPAGYKIPEVFTGMATWEGICHGWAVAAGIAPRPEKTVWITLPNGKRMPFYPDDLKALTSLTWANSTVQDAVLTEGLRCNNKRPDKDEFGRYIDKTIDKHSTDKDILPKCADVHPAVYHTTVVNVLGREGRSFVVDKSAEASIANQPVSGYEYKYFNPANGKEGTLEASALAVDSYKNDPFKSARNTEAKFIVGVDMILKYVDWENPRGKDTNSPSDDHIGKMAFNYDLELDANYNIVGGQWRVKKDGNARLFKNNTNQPDFFWIVPRNYKQFFKPMTGVPEWDFAKSTLPPKEYLAASKGAHSFIYQSTRAMDINGEAQKCRVVPIKKGSGPVVDVDCEFKTPRPQPMLNVLNKLVEEANR